MDDALNRCRQRLQQLDDREQLRELQATYCFLVDDRRFDELVERWFTADARCDFRDAKGAIAPLISNGGAEIRVFYTQVVASLLDDMCHTVHNQRLTIDGEVASGECYFELTAKHPATGDAVVGAGRYLDRYRRVDGAWRCAERTAIIFHMAPLAEGWVRRPLLRALTGQ
ncbi:MAG: nuclear transport factor 2 family protein [Deltaproteobacteria bacterium]|nr:nuclear transport factor 2 family protein [Deltaproteobacteria bacterium]